METEEHDLKKFHRLPAVATAMVLLAGSGAGTLSTAGSTISVFAMGLDSISWAFGVADPPEANRADTRELDTSKT